MEEDIVVKTFDRFGLTATEIFNRSFPGVNHWIVENYLLAYEERGVIPVQVTKFCNAEEARHEV